jgi:hypothetical protein
MPENEVPIALKFVADATGVKNETASIGQELRGLANLGSTFAFGTALSGVGFSVAENLRKGAETIQEFGQEALKLQRQLGGTAEQASAWVATFDRFNISVDGGSRALIFFERNLRGVGDASESAIISGKSFTGVLSDLGISATTQNGSLREFDQVIGDVAEAFARHKGSVDNGVNAQVLFGRAGRDLLPILEGGRERIEEAAQAAQKYGLTLTGQNLAAVYAFGQAHKDADEAMQGVAITAGLTLLPWMTRLANQGASLAQGFNQNLIPALRSVGEVRIGGTDVGNLAITLGTIGVAAIPVGVGIQALRFAFAPLAGLIGATAAAVQGLTVASEEAAVAVATDTAAESAKAVAAQAEAVAIGESSAAIAVQLALWPELEAASAAAGATTAAAATGATGFAGALAAVGAVAAPVAAGLAAIAAIGIPIAMMFRHSTEEGDAYRKMLDSLPEAERKAVSAEVDRRLQEQGMQTEDINAERARVARQIAAEGTFPGFASDQQQAARQRQIEEANRRRLLELNTTFQQQAPNPAGDDAARANFQLGEEAVNAILQGVDSQSSKAMQVLKQEGTAFTLALATSMREAAGGTGPSQLVRDAVTRMSDQAQEAFKRQREVLGENAPLASGLIGTRLGRAEVSDQQVESQNRLAALQRTESEAQRQRNAEELQANLALYDVRSRIVDLTAAERPLRMAAAQIDLQLRDYGLQRVQLLEHEQTLRAQQAAAPATRRQEDIQFEIDRLQLQATVDRSFIPQARERMRDLVLQSTQADLDALEANRTVTEAQRREQDTQLTAQIGQTPTRVAQTQIAEQMATFDLVKQHLDDEQAAYTDIVDRINIRYDREHLLRQGALDEATRQIDYLDAEAAEYDKVYKALSDAYSKAIAESNAFTIEEQGQIRQRMGLRESEVQQVEDYWRALAGDLTPDERRRAQLGNAPRTATADFSGGIINAIGPGGAGGNQAGGTIVQISFANGAYTVYGGQSGSAEEIAAVLARAMAEYAGSHDHGANPRLGGAGG